MSNTKFFFRESIRLQAIAWPIYIALMFLINRHVKPALGWSDQMMAVSILFVVLNACILLFYLLLLRKWIWRTVLFAIGLFVLVTEVVPYLLYLYSGDVGSLDDILPWSDVDERYYWRMFSRYISVLIMSACIAFAIKSKINARELLKEATLRYAKELEAQETRFALRSLQINPHFVNNILNNMQGQLRSTHPEIADQMRRLGLLLDYQLTVSNEGTKYVLIHREIAALRDYITLEKSRFPNCYVQLDISGEATMHKIVPLTLLILVENAFKYGCLGDPLKPISVRLLLEEDKVVFECHNYIDPSKRTLYSTKLGHNIVRNRLDIVCPDRYTFEAAEINTDEYRVRLTIDQI